MGLFFLESWQPDIILLLSKPFTSKNSTPAYIHEVLVLSGFFFFTFYTYSHGENYKESLKLDQDTETKH